MSLIGEAVVKFTGDSSGVVSALKNLAKASQDTAAKAGASASSTESAFARMKKAGEDMKDSFADAVKGAERFSQGILAAGAAAIGFGVASASGFEQTRVAMQTVVGNAKDTDAIMKQLAQTAKTTPFEFTDVAKWATQMLAAGSSIDNVNQRLTMLGDISQGNADRMTSIVHAFNQMENAGKLTGKEMLEFNEAMVPIMPALAKITGKSVQEITDDLNSGMVIPASLVEKAFDSLTSKGGLFYHAMANQSKTLAGLWSNVLDSVGFTVRNIVGITETGEVRAGSFFDALRNGAQVLLQGLEKLNDITPETRAQIISIAGAVLGTAAAFLGLITAMKVIILLSNPFMLIFALIAAVLGIQIYQSLQKAQAGFKNTAAAASDANGKIQKTSKDTAPAVEKMSNDTVKALKKIDDQIKKTKDDYVQSLADIVFQHQDAVAKIKGDIAEEDAAYKESADQRAADYKDSVDQMASDHADKTQSILDDIEKEKANGRYADPDKLKKLQDELDKENTAYQKQTDKAAAAYQKQVDKEKESHDKKLSELQKELDTELQFLQKHNADVAAVQDVARLDEIDKLKKDTAERLAQYEQDKVDAIQKGSEKNNTLAAQADSAGGSIGDSFAKASKEIQDAMGDAGTSITGTLDSISPYIDKAKQAFTFLKNHIDGVMTAIQIIIATRIALAILPIVIAMGPYGILVVAIGAALLAIGIAVASNWDNIKATFERGIDWVKNNWMVIAGYLLNPFSLAFMAIAKLWNAIFGKLKIKVPDWVPELGGREWAIPTIPGYARGVQNFVGGLARINEEGGEIVSLPSGTTVIPHDLSKIMVQQAAQSTGVRDVTINFGPGSVTNTDDKSLNDIGRALGKSFLATLNGAP